MQKKSVPVSVPVTTDRLHDDVRRLSAEIGNLSPRLGEVEKQLDNGKWLPLSLIDLTQKVSDLSARVAALEKPAMDSWWSRWL